MAIPFINRRFAVVAALVAPLSLGACGNKDDAGGKGSGSAKAPPSDAAAAAPAQRPEGPVGSVTAKVLFTGEAPPMPKLRRGSDPVCNKTEAFAETILVNDDNTLRNVVVRVTPGTVKAWTPSDVVKVSQTECMYRPRVQPAVRGQKLHVSNADMTSHNVHLRTVELGKRQGIDTLWNRQQPKGTPPIQSQVEGDTDIVKVKCDQHGWMVGYLVVSDNPYAAVSNEQGTLTIADVPVGERELQAWHEFYGVKTVKVTVEEGKTAEVTFTYDAVADNPIKGATPAKPADDGKAKPKGGAK